MSTRQHVVGAKARHRFAASFALALALVIAGLPSPDSAQAANSTCSTPGNPATAECAGVPTDGISYGSTVTTINVNDPDGGVTPVNSGTPGIFLKQSGGSATSAPAAVSFTTTTVVVGKDADDKDIVWTVVATPSTATPPGAPNPVLVSGQYVRKVADDSFSIGGSTYNGLQLAQQLNTAGVDAGASITGALTVNNPASGGSASSFTTTADGIHVESVGGGGGNGGCSTVLGLYTWCSSGKTGGSAGSIGINSSGVITVTGAGYGVTATSTGGKGGNGGGSFGVFGSEAGSGGNGGAGGDINIILGGGSDVTTEGNGRHGVFASSKGGDGGSGGSSSGLVALGEKGGNGGDAGKVTVTSAGKITTHGDKAYGIYAESVGAGAGSGSDTGGLVAFGGNGGGESSGNEVTVTSTGQILTTGVDSYGIFAQSVGGGGGDGGTSGGVFTVGGRAGSGGDGDVVKVTNAGTITTEKRGAIALFAQSVGGGGGNGGGAISVGINGSMALGGSGGPGGDGGDVFINDTTDLGSLPAGEIRTGGDKAHGILAQSIGGGGGNGGLAVAVAIDGGTGVSAGVALGGTGGDGGDGHDVTVNANGIIETHGKMAYGIVAQSVGGGGGMGGGAVSVSTGAIAFGLAMGGTGGKGGDGRDVVVNTALGTTITTTGANAIGILAQSVGGGGGNGGFAAAGSFAPASLAVALGGAGSEGGDGGVVTVDNKATITTDGANATGIFAQSVGGGGGNGGFSLGATLGVVAISAAVGGDGAGGGDGKDVIVKNAGSIVTFGDLAYGIQAQSIGGGGGNGGSAVAASAAFSPEPSIPAVAISIAVGGSADDGGMAGTVIVANTGIIETHGTSTHGIYAQSVGGGGGIGGYAASGVLSIGTNTAGVTVSVGGTGGDGGDGGLVTIGKTALGEKLAGTSITTYGEGANAIFAQSVGGGGGEGGFAVAVNLGKSNPAGLALNLGVSVGGTGGEGGNGDIVDVYSNQLLRTFGDSAAGIHAQSVGGGGGNGGNAITGMLQVVDTTDPSSQAISAAVAVGGNGGVAGYGDDVFVENRGTITTGLVLLDGGQPVRDANGDPLVAGANSHGILAQSVGGGGGTGGRANSMNMIVGKGCGEACPADPKVNVTMRVSLGGKGGAAGDGGDVDVDNFGAITTFGAAANGILAQSVGGGGGYGGNGVIGSGELIPVPVDLLVAIAFGKTKQYSDLSVAVGGDGGGSGIGGSVTVDNSGNITTYGSNSSGIFAQSVGGGGGVGGLANIGATGKVGVGGKGTSGGNGGEVIVKQLDGQIETFGASAFGIFAESVGGGGGLAGNVDRLLAKEIGPLPVVNVGMGLALGQGGGSGGNGGDVTVDLDGKIFTHGDSATAIFAHSIGGGGGVMGELGNEPPGLNLLSWHIGSNGDVGDAGEVKVTVTGTVATSGNNAGGIFAQSSGGDGLGKDVTVTVTGVVQTAALLGAEDRTLADPLRGLGSIGITAHSSGADGNGNIIIKLLDEDGAVIGGRTDDDYTGVGIMVIDGDENTITNYGLLSTANGVDGGFAIVAFGSNPDALAEDKVSTSSTFESLVAGLGVAQRGGNEAVSNFGTVVGSIDLGEGINTFINETTGFFASGAIAKVGVDNLLTNNGRMSPGGDDRVMTTAITGDLQQTETGTFDVDLDFALSGADGTADPAGSADHYDLTGSVDMAGKVAVNLLNAGTAKPGEHTAVIAHSDVAFGDDGVTISTTKTAVLDFWLNTSPKDLMLGYSIDFAPADLVGNQISIGEYINAVQTAGGSPALEPFINGLVYIPDMQTYAETLEQLSPETYIVNEVAAYAGMLQFENQLMSCRVPDGVYKFTAEGECVWAAMGGRKTEIASTNANMASEQQAYSMAAGLQGAMNDVVRLGGGVSYSKTSSETESSVSTGQLVQGGGVLKLQAGETVLALAALGGYAWFDVSRMVDVPNGPSYVLNGQQGVGLLGGHARLSHSFAGEDGYIRPSLDVGVTEAFFAPFEETGGPLALTLDEHSELFVTVLPAIEIGGEVKLGNDAVLRPFAKVGLQAALLGGSPTATATLEGAPDGVDGFTVASTTDPYVIDLTLGMDLITGNGFALKVTGDAKLGETQRAYGGNFKLSAPF